MFFYVATLINQCMSKRRKLNSSCYNIFHQEWETHLWQALFVLFLNTRAPTCTWELLFRTQDIDWIWVKSYLSDVTREFFERYKLCYDSSVVVP